MANWFLGSLQKPHPPFQGPIIHQSIRRPNRSNPRISILIHIVKFLGCSIFVWTLWAPIFALRSRDESISVLLSEIPFQVCERIWGKTTISLIHHELFQSAQDYNTQIVFHIGKYNFSNLKIFGFVIPWSSNCLEIKGYYIVKLWPVVFLPIHIESTMSLVASARSGLTAD